MNNEPYKLSLVGKTLYAKGLKDNLDGTFEALITFPNYKCMYTCRLYGNKNDIRKLPFDIAGIPITLECIDYDDNDVLLVKIVG